MIGKDRFNKGLIELNFGDSLDIFLPYPYVGKFVQFGPFGLPSSCIDVNKLPLTSRL